MTTLVSGASGALGRRLLAKLDAPRALVRRPQKEGEVAWSSDRAVPDDAMRGVRAIVHLAGEPVAEGRWTAEKKARIRSSRVQGTRHLVDAIARASERPAVLVCASAVGIYGNRGDEILDESSALGDDFLAQVCREWEDEAARAESHGVRVVRLRIGVVLMRGDGILGKLVPVFKAGVGGRLGDGKQWVPWVHVDDVLGLILRAIEDPSFRGAIGASAPTPVTNAEMSKTLGLVLHRPAIVPTPQFAVKLAFGELATVILGSQRVLPRAALDFGYRFVHTDLEPALRAETDI